jgi:hypothetical protein
MASATEKSADRRLDLHDGFQAGSRGGPRSDRAVRRPEVG